MTTFNRLAIPEVVEIVPPKYGDGRGFFSEVWKRSDFEAQSIAIDWLQDNQSFSAERGTVRGLHFQVPPVAQDKLIRVVRGSIFDVAVDIRKGSPTYGQWVGCDLSAERWNQLLVPAGFAHGFMTTAPDTEVIYKVSAPWSRDHEQAILWNDSDLAIAWPKIAQPVLSDKDKVARRFADYLPVFEWEGQLMRTVLVTGGAGFIGSAVCRHLVATSRRVINFDKLTYAGNLASLREVEDSPNYRFVQGDISDIPLILSLLQEENVQGIMHLAAESHVDRSIDGPGAFVETNVVGTFRLLSAALEYWRGLEGDRREAFRFHHISTDEVFGDLPFDSGVFTEDTPYAPSSPYSASKAASDHFVRAWHETYGLPVVLSNCSNNYGPFHFPEKLVPLTILNALEGKSLPVYGRGENVRDWLYVEDHARALDLVLTKGRVGESYNIGGREEHTNLHVVELICDVLDARVPLPGGGSRRGLITFVTDRPGHDRRYAIDPAKIEAELGWHAVETFKSGLEKTVDWYLANEAWWEPIRSGTYSGGRLGMG